MDDWFDQLDESPKAEVVHVPDLLLKRTDSDGKLEALRQMEDRLLMESTSIIEHSLRFADIEPTDEAPPEEWVREHGEEQAKRMFRVARAAWLGKKDAPFGMELARSVMLGIIKARSTDKAPKELNVQVVQINVRSEAKYEVIDETESR